MTDPGWLNEIPAEHPALIVAEGLLPYLSETENRQQLERIINQFSSGEMIFDVLSQWGPRTSNLIKWGVPDGRVIEQWNPRLSYLESTSVMTGYERIPLRGQQLLFHTLCALPIVDDPQLKRLVSLLILRPRSAAAGLICLSLLHRRGCHR